MLRTLRNLFLPFFRKDRSQEQEKPIDASVPLNILPTDVVNMELIYSRMVTIEFRGRVFARFALNLDEDEVSDVRMEISIRPPSPAYPTKLFVLWRGEGKAVSESYWDEQGILRPMRIDHESAREYWQAALEHFGKYLTDCQEEKDILSRFHTAMQQVRWKEKEE